MIKNLARTVSFVLHPLLIPVYLLFFIFNADTIFAYTPSPTKLYSYIVTVFTLLIMPLVSLPLFKHFKLINSYELDDKQERVYPILVTVAFAFLGFWLLGRIAYTNIIQQVYLIMIILLSLFSVITLRWKISMHLTAMGGFCGFVLMLGLKYPGDIRGLFMLLLIMAGILGSCRLYLGKHTPLQVYLGFLLGFVFVFVFLY